MAIDSERPDGLGPGIEASSGKGAAARFRPLPALRRSAKKLLLPNVSSRTQGALPSTIRQAVVRLLGLLDLKVVSSKSAAPFLTDDPEFEALYEKCKPYTMTSIERLYALYQASKYVSERNIPGALVECGVWKGGSAMMMAHSLLARGVRDRDVYLYDTFEGMAEPDERDVNHRGKPARDRWLKQKTRTHNEWCYASLEDVRRNLERTGYPSDRFRLVQGKVEETIPGQIPETIALLRLDTDWFKSTYHELTHLFPRLSPGGVLIIDDYGHWRGARDATDRFFKEANTPVLLQRIDHSGRLVLKV